MGRTVYLCAIVAVAIAVLGGCDSSTEPETPAFKNGSSSELAIALPPVFPPEPKLASVVTEWWVIQSGKLWFRNVEGDPIDLSLWVKEVRTGAVSRVGLYTLDGFQTKAMVLDARYITDEYAGQDYSWYLVFQQRSVSKTILVGISS